MKDAIGKITGGVRCSAARANVLLDTFGASSTKGLQNTVSRNALGSGSGKLPANQWLAAVKEQCEDAQSD